MSGDSLPWRAILWVERFLPAPRPVRPAVRRSDKAAWWVVFVSLLTVSPTVVTVLARRRPELGEILAQNHVLFEQLGLVVTGCMILAVVGFAVHFGAKAWRDAKGGR